MDAASVIIDIIDALLLGTPSAVFRDELVKKYQLEIAEANTLVRAAEREINTLDRSIASRQDMINVLREALNEHSPFGTAFKRISDRIESEKRKQQQEYEDVATQQRKANEASVKIDEAYNKLNVSLGNLVSDTQGRDLNGDGNKEVIHSNPNTRVETTNEGRRVYYANEW